MNDLIRKIELRDVVTLAVLLVATITYFTATKQDIVVINNKLEIYEEKMEKLEANTTRYMTREESNLVLARLDRIENKLDSILERR